MHHGFHSFSLLFHISSGLWLVSVKCVVSVISTCMLTLSDVDIFNIEDNSNVL